MVLRKYIRSIAGTIMFLALLFCFSCENMEPVIINCTECYTIEPKVAEINIKLENTFSHEMIYVKIFEGYLEDNLLYKSLSTTSESASTTVALNKMYTVTATFYINGNYYTAVNNFTPRIKYDKENCVEPCYYVYDKDINLKLKYTK